MMRAIALVAASILVFTGCLKKSEKDSGPTPPPSETKQAKLISVVFERSKNTQLSKDIAMQIVENQKLVWGYLPNDISLSGLKPTFVVENGDMYVNDAKQQSGVTYQNFTSPVTYVLRGENEQSVSYTFKIYPYTGLPYVYFTTGEGKTFRQTVTNREEWKSVKIDIDALGVSGLENYSGLANLRGRGNSTWVRFPKKAFNMKLEVKDPILGMPKHKRWCFLANWRDRTLMRNDVTNHIARIADNLEWTPRGHYAEVVFNGEHMGNYYICEHIRVDKNRVDIDEMTTTDTEGDALTGGYLLEYDFNWDEDPKFKSSVCNLPIMLKSPEADDTGYFPPSQMAYITNFINGMEQALEQGNYSEVYENYMDMPSFVDYMLVAALVGNAEYYTPGSVYGYKKRNGKLYAGPVWDSDYTTYATEQSSYKSRTNILSNAWWYKFLYNDQTFKNALKSRFAALKSQLQTVPQYIDQRAAYLSRSEVSDRSMWPLTTEVMAQIDMLSTVNGDERVEDCATYLDAVERMKSMYNGRLIRLENYVNTGTWSD